MSAALVLAALLSAAPESTAAAPAPAASPVAERPLAARDTADVGHAGQWSVGVFNPWRLAVADGVELEAHPVAFFVSPHLTGRFGVWQKDLRVAVEGGFDVPTLAMRLTKGYLFPSWATSANDIGWMVVPRAGGLVSGNARARDVWTARADVAVRVRLSPNAATPLDSFLAPLDLLWAAPLTGGVVRGGGAYDLALTERLRLRGELNLYVVCGGTHLYVDGVDRGPLANRNPVIVTGHVGLDVAVGKQSRFTVGVYAANRDQGATAVVPDADGFSKRVPVRSTDFLPTLDFIWAGG